MTETRQIRYRSGYKHQNAEDAYFETGIHVGHVVGTEDGYVILWPMGRLLIKEGFSWDGASGPMPDKNTIMRGSMAHDALYRLMREGKVPGENRQLADRLLRRLCLEDGMPIAEAESIYLIVRKRAASAARPTVLTGLRAAP